MRIIRTFNQHPLIFSIVIGMVVLFMRCWTLPHSFLYLSIHILVTFVACINYFTNVDMTHVIPEVLFSILITTITVIFLMSFANSLNHFFKTKRKKDIVVIPLLINIITICLVVYGNCFVILPDFYANFKSRQEVIEMVKLKKLTLSKMETYNFVDEIDSDITYTANLPGKYNKLSITDIQGESKGKIYIIKGEDNQIKLIVFLRSIETEPEGERYTAFMYKFKGNSISYKEITGVPYNGAWPKIISLKKIITPNLNPYKGNWFWIDVLYGD